jgi:hypothetical protein
VTQHDRDAGTLTVARALGDIPANTAPADAQNVIDQLADEEVYNNAERLLRALGWEGPHPPTRR